MASRPATLALRQRSARASFFHQPHHHHHQRRHASILFALSALSNSRETQHFNKATRLSRVEHSPALKLIKTSEVDPYPLPEQARRGAASVSGAEKEEEGESRSGRDEINAAAGGSASAASSSGAGIPSSGIGQAAAAGSGSGGDGKKPPEAESAMDEEDLEPDEYDERAEQDALKAGKAVILEHIQTNRRLRQRMKEYKSQVKKLEGDALQKREALEDERSTPSFGAFFFGVAWVITLALYLSVKNPPSSYAQKAEHAREVQELREKAREETARLCRDNVSLTQKLTTMEASAAREVQELREKAREETVRLCKNKVDLRKKLTEMENATSKHEAQNVDWTRKAEELKRAVEKKDASTLTRSEQNAYLEALVFLKVKEQPERKWWRGLFWSQG